MDRLIAARTTFVNAHWLATVKNLDCILAPAHVRNIVRGSHNADCYPNPRHHGTIQKRTCRTPA